MSLSVCLSVCLSAPVSQKSTAKLHAMLTMAVDPLSSGNTAICYVLPVLWMASCLAIIGQEKATPVGRILRMTHQEAALGAKSNDYDCLVVVVVVVVVVIACIDVSDLLVGNIKQIQL